MKSLIHHLSHLTPCTAGCLLVTTLFLFALPSSAEPDLLSGDLGLSTSSPANSLIDPSRANEDMPDTDSALPHVSPAQAADLVRRSTGGQVMSVNSHQTENGMVYRVKVLNSGRMKIVRVDGQTGQIVNN